MPSPLYHDRTSLFKVEPFRLQEEEFEGPYSRTATPLNFPEFTTEIAQYCQFCALLRKELIYRCKYDPLLLVQIGPARYYMEKYVNSDMPNKDNGLYLLEIEVTQGNIEVPPLMFDLFTSKG
jgi:hypothetical protein